MMTVKRSECAVLPLVLKRKWYALIASGKKPEEYRENKPYWKKRILRWLYDPRPCHIVAFSCGYNKPDMWFIASTSWNTYTGAERPDLGEPREEHFKIHLLERVQLVDDITGDTYDECRKFLAEHGVPEVLGGERIE